MRCCWSQQQDMPVHQSGHPQGNNSLIPLVCSLKGLTWPNATCWDHSTFTRQGRYQGTAIGAPPGLCRATGLQALSWCPLQVPTGMGTALARSPPSPCGGAGQDKGRDSSRATVSPGAPCQLAAPVRTGTFGKCLQGPEMEGTQHYI